MTTRACTAKLTAARRAAEKAGHPTDERVNCIVWRGDHAAVWAKGDTKRSAGHPSLRIMRPHQGDQGSSPAEIIAITIFQPRRSTTMTNKYLVTWNIDIKADDPESAALEAKRIQQKPDSTANVFDVRILGEDPIRIEPR